MNPTTYEQGIYILKNIEAVARTCYQSADKITDDSYLKMVKILRDNKHDAMLEFGNMTVRFVMDRGVSHEMVRQRLCSFAQESTRYVSRKNIEVVCAEQISLDEEAFAVWCDAMTHAEQAYGKLLDLGLKPEIARDVLPTCLKTEIVVSCNIREWRHIFELRCDHKAHPSMRALMIPLLEDAKKLIPIVFDDITY